MITFTNQPINPPHNAYNNSIIEFGVDTGTPDYATISAGGHTFIVYPDSNGSFYFNLKHVVSTMINQDQFTDSVVPVAGGYLYQDDSLFTDVAVSVEVTLTDASVVTSDIVYPFVKSVKQLTDVRYFESELRLLSPEATQVAYLSYFEGYPFDISVYSDIARTITVKNKRTGGTLSLNMAKGVNRIFISNGENDVAGFENDMPLHLGFNELEFSTTAELKFTLMLEKKEAECGHFIKWMNPAGGWSYYRFMDLYREELKTGTIDRVQRNFDNLKDTSSNISITGKEGERAKELQSGMVSESERILLDTLTLSPQVFLYLNELHAPMEAGDFIAIEIDNGTFSKANKNRFSNMTVKAILPNLYTQTL